jgi:hypothetical protein
VEIEKFSKNNHNIFKGDYDVEEDEEGAISIGGQELSFETWGQLTRTQEDGVCKADVVLPRQKKRKPKLIYDVASTSNGKSSAKKRQQKGEDKDDKIDVGFLMLCYGIRFETVLMKRNIDV